MWDAGSETASACWCWPTVVAQTKSRHVYERCVRIVSVHTPGGDDLVTASSSSHFLPSTRPLRAHPPSSPTRPHFAFPPLNCHTSAGSFFSVHRSLLQTHHPSMSTLASTPPPVVPLLQFSLPGRKVLSQGKLSCAALYGWLALFGWLCCPRVRTPRLPHSISLEQQLSRTTEDGVGFLTSRGKK